jgi:hypothetical protein
METARLLNYANFGNACLKDFLPAGVVCFQSVRTVSPRQENQYLLLKPIFCEALVPWLDLHNGTLAALLSV